MEYKKHVELYGIYALAEVWTLQEILSVIKFNVRAITDFKICFFLIGDFGWIVKLMYK